MDKNYNRIKAVLAETGKTGKWLADKLGVNPTTVSRWSQNISQPDLETLYRIAELLDVDPRVLITGKS